MSSSSGIQSSEDPFKITEFDDNWNPIEKKKSTKESKSEIRERGFKHLARFDMASRVFVVVALVLFVATIVLLGVTQARRLDPMFPIIGFSFCVGAIIVIAAISSCKRAVAKRHTINPDEYENTKFPLKEHKNMRKKD